MKRKIISFILTFLLVQPVFCFANSNISENGTDEAFTLLENDNSTISTGTLDSINLYDNIKKISANSEVPILTLCKLSEDGYDDALAAVITNCGENSKFQLSVSTENDNLTVPSDNGVALIMGIPLKESFNATIKGEVNNAISCYTEVVGAGMDFTPNPGVQIFLNCKNSAKTIISGIISTLLLLLI